MTDTKRKPKKGLIIVVVLALFATVFRMWSGNDKLEVAHFEIDITIQDSLVKLECNEGCTWMGLEFMLEDNAGTKLLSDRGIENTEDVLEGAKFLFDLEIEIEIEGMELNLKSRVGTQWDNLSKTGGTLNKWTITESGIEGQ
jgi:hypothetical protein